VFNVVDRNGDITSTHTSEERAKEFAGKRDTIEKQSGEIISIAELPKAKAPLPKGYAITKQTVEGEVTPAGYAISAPDSGKPLTIVEQVEDLKAKVEQMEGARREEANKELAARDAEGFVEQVNGKDLSNWQGAVDNYEVVDGAITCKQGKGGDLLTKDEFENGIIRVEFKLPPAGNNGIALRTPLGGHSASDGLELQVIDSDGYNAKQAAAGKAGLQPYQYHGSLYHCVGAKHGYLRPVGEWNFQEIEVQGQRLKVTLNGTKILDMDIDSLDRTQIPHPPKGLDSRKGLIGFAGHSDPVAFRSFTVKRM
jgi:hypothetical protein